MFLFQSKNPRVYVCRCDTTSTTKTSNIVGGTSNIPSYLVTDSFLYSTLVNTSRYQHASKVSFKNKSQDMNSFGRWEGAPSGFGAPPKNQF
jgi:hypothetical protein